MNAPAAVPVSVLVVDDDDATRALLSVVFGRRKDIVVECVSDGDAALAQIRRKAYDVLVLDLMLPGANGFDVIRELKSRAPVLLSRTIVLTAMAESTLRDFDDARFLRRLMRKPFDLDDLVGEVLACALPRGADGSA